MAVVSPAAAAAGKKKSPAAGGGGGNKAVATPTPTSSSSQQMIPLLEKFWHPLCHLSDVSQSRPYACDIFGEPLVVYRAGDQHDHIVVARDRCPHRSAPMSLGFVKDDTLYCRYHGFGFDRNGTLCHVPSLSKDARLPRCSLERKQHRVTSDGVVWVFVGPAEDTGEPLPPDPKPLHRLALDARLIDEGYLPELLQSRVYDVPAELLVENLLDFAHPQYAHAGTIGKAGSYPEYGDNMPELDQIVVKPTPSSANAKPGSFVAQTARPKLRVTFEPPSGILLEVGVSPDDDDDSEDDKNQVLPGAKALFVQVHYVIPTGAHSSRLLLINYRSFLKWLPSKWVFASNEKVMEQDAVVLQGQAARTAQSAPRWDVCVRVDKPGLMYAKWLRNALGGSEPENSPLYFTDFKEDAPRQKGKQAVAAESQALIRDLLVRMVASPDGLWPDLEREARDWRRERDGVMNGKKRRWFLW